MSDDATKRLRVLATETKDHAWLSRFRKADAANRYAEMSPAAARMIAGYVDELIDAALAENRFDDPAPLTDDALRANGFADHPGSDFLTLAVNGTIIEAYRGVWYVAGQRVQPQALVPRTAGDLHRLLAVLRADPTPTTQGG